MFYRADYLDPDGKPIAIAVDVTYMLETMGDRPRIFAFVAGDEMAPIGHRLVDDQGKPR